MPDEEGFLEKRKRLLKESVQAFTEELKGDTEADQVPAEQHDQSNQYEQIGQLNELRHTGALTEEEFQREKARLLERE